MKMNKKNIININGNPAERYQCAVHDKDHTIILNGRPVRTYTCDNEKGGSRIILNGVPYNIYKRTPKNQSTVFLNGVPYNGGELGELKQTRWRTSKVTGEQNYSTKMHEVHEYSPQEGTININGKTIVKNVQGGYKKGGIIVVVIIGIVAYAIIRFMMILMNHLHFISYFI